ncbi:hypothetical protein [Paenarthrobacter nitroguajacolicus]|uniref:hypothetical protein n=1 Tax=Paenarthrobacter nitroguajacolicus TaxID=211146 RepID=UPI0040542372
MSEQFAPRGRHDQQAIDHLLADSGLTGDTELRAELLELRSLASTAPVASDAVRALMAGSQVAVTEQIAATQHITTADGPAASSGAPTAVLAAVAPESVPGSAPVDELAARRRKKRRTAIAGLAVAVSLAGGATAAVASEGGLPGAFEHLGSAIGSVVLQLTPGPGNVPQQGGPAGTPSDQQPVREESEPTPAQNQPEQAPAAPGSPAVPAPGPQPGGTAQHTPNTPKAPQHEDPGNGIIPSPPALPVTPPEIDPSKIDPSKLGPSGVPVPVPSQLVPSLPARP